MISVLDENKLIILSSSPESGGQTLFISVVKSCLMSLQGVQKKTMPLLICIYFYIIISTGMHLAYAIREINTL